MALRVTRQLVEVLAPGQGKARVTRQLVEVLGPGHGKARVTRQYVEVLAPYSEIYEETIAQQIPLTQSAWIVQQIEASAESPIGLDQDAVVIAPQRVSAGTLVALAQEAQRNAFYQRSVDTQLDLSHTATYIGPKSVDAVNLLTLDQGARLAETYELSAGHTIPLGQDAEPSGAKRVWAENTIELAQIADTFEKRRSVETQIGLSQSAELERIYCTESHIELSQLAQEGFVDLAAESQIQLSQRARPNPIRIGPGEGFDVDLPGTQIELTPSAETNIRVASAETQIELDQDLGASVPIHAEAATSLIETEGIWDQETLSFVEVWVGGLNHEAIVEMAKAQGFHQYLQTTQEARVVHIRADAIDLEAQSALLLDQGVTLSETGEAETHIELSDVAVCYVGIPADTEIELHDDVQADVVRGTNSNTPIGIYHSVTFTLETGGSVSQYSPFVGESTVPGVPEPPPQALQGPMAGIQVPFQLVYPAVGDVTDAVSLAAPRLGNKDRLSFNRVQRETRGGTLIIYADAQWPKVQTLVLSFSGLLRVEAQALLKFMEDHLGQEVGLIDWEHRYWRGVVVTPDEPVIEDRFDSYSASFEFQGELDPTWNPQVVPPTLRYSAVRPPKEDRPYYEPEEPEVPEPEYQDFYTAETDTAVRFGSPVYLKATGHADLAQANGQPQTQVVGLSINEVEPGFGCQYITEGKITREDWTEIAGTATLAPGATYFLDPSSPGRITETAPTNSGQYVVRIGRATSTLVLDVEIELPILL